MNQIRSTYFKILEYSIIVFIGVLGCIKPSSGKFPPLFLSSVTPYTPADFGYRNPGGGFSFSNVTRYFRQGTRIY